MRKLFRSVASHNTGQHRLKSEPVPARVLARAGAVWLMAAALGQILFGIYIFGFYGPTLTGGNFAVWAENKNLIDGYKEGDTIGNLGFAAHVALSGVLTLGGLAQLIPALRRAAPSVHRWNGRMFVAAAVATAIGGLWLVWVRGTQTGLSEAIGISLNGVLILVFATLAVRAARLRNFTAHEAWAFRLFLAVSGVWFLRVGIATYGVVASALLQLEDPHFGIVFSFWSFGCYLVPLAVYEAYRTVKAHGSGLAQSFMTGLLVVLTLATLVGSLAMFAGQWLELLLRT